MGLELQTLDLAGRQYVVLAKDDWERIQEQLQQARGAQPPLPAYPPADARGLRDAIGYARVSIARDIIRERTALRWSQQELARRAGVRQETISRLESGRHTATPRIVSKIERALAKGVMAKPTTAKR